MDLEHVSIKHLGELEQQLTLLLKTMRTAKLSEDQIYASLQLLEQKISKERRSRYDENNSEYHGY